VCVCVCVYLYVYIYVCITKILLLLFYLFCQLFLRTVACHVTRMTLFRMALCYDVHVTIYIFYFEQQAQNDFGFVAALGREDTPSKYPSIDTNMQYAVFLKRSNVKTAQNPNEE